MLTDSVIEVDSMMATMVLNEEAIARSGMMGKQDEKDWSGSLSLLLNSSNEEAKASACIQKEVKLFEREKNVILNLTVNEIQLRLRFLDLEMQREIENLKTRYDKKRELILRAIDVKKKNHQMF